MFVRLFSLPMPKLDFSGAAGRRALADRADLLAPADRRDTAVDQLSAAAVGRAVPVGKARFHMDQVVPVVRAK